MKKLLFLSITAVLLISCSEDDSPAPVASDDVTYIKKAKQIFYSNGEVFMRVETDYVDGLQDKIYFYTPDNELTEYRIFNYNNENLPVSIIHYTPQNFETASTVYTYDELGRVKDRVSTYGTYNEVHYSFNNDNTITATTTYANNNSNVKTYYLNSNGIVYKEVGATSYELTFDGLNPVSSSASSGLSKTFVYDQINPVSNITNNVSEYKPNSILRAVSLKDAETSTANKYLIKVISGSDVTDYTYTFNPKVHQIYA
jgi:hypothetical protein